MSAVTPDNLLAAAIQAGVLTLVGAPLPRLLGIHSPRARLAYWRALLLACLLLPFLQPVVLDRVTSQGLPAFVAEPVTASVDASRSTDPWPAASAWSSAVGPLAVIAAGIAIRLAWFAFGLLTLRRMRRRAALLHPRPPSVNEAARLAGADAQFRLSDQPTAPITFGLFQPIVIVPRDFAEFEPREQRAIACHELTHVRRRDWVRNAGDEVVRAVAWFHPSAWWLTRQIRLSREQLVDQEVVQQTGARRAYLDALLRLSASDRRTGLVPAPLFLGRSHLSLRVALLLKEVRMSRPRLALSFLAMAAVLVLAGRVVVSAFPLHAVAPEQAPQAGAAKPGQPTAPAADAAKKALRKIEGTRPAFPAGSSDLPVIVSGTVAPDGTVRDVTALEGAPDAARIAEKAVRGWRFSAPGRPAGVIVGFNPAAGGMELASQPPVLVGKTVKPPAKIKDVKPVYPKDAQEARVQGIVILETEIAADGSVAAARVLRSVPMLDRAALVAVLGWKFAAPGFPVQMVVTVNFTLGDGPSKSLGQEGVAGGVKGGVAGGVAGGVKGGVEGGATADQETTWMDLPGGERAVRVGGPVKPPQKTLDVKPVYPQDAQDARVEGIVILEAKIGPDGKVADAKIVRSVPLLDQAALDAVKQWEFVPTVVEGKAVPVVMTITVNFTLQ